jgi:hypothetical protein
MNERADFADLKNDDSEEEEEDSFPDYSGDKWSGQATQGSSSNAPESLLILEYLEGCDYIQDLLRLVKLAGSVYSRKIMARHVLDDLIITYKNTAQQLREDKKTFLKDLKLLEAIDALSRESIKLVVIDYLVQKSSRIDDIVATGPEPTSDVSVLGGAFPKVTFIDKRSTNCLEIYLRRHWTFATRYIFYFRLMDKFLLWELTGVPTNVKWFWIGSTYINRLPSQAWLCFHARGETGSYGKPSKGGSQRTRSLWMFLFL